MQFPALWRNAVEAFQNIHPADKDRWQLDPNCGQVVHIKKTAVINFLCGDSPKRQPVGLRVEQLIQRIKTEWVAGFAVDLDQRLFNRLLHLWRFSATTFQAPLDDFLFANALRGSLWISLGAFWQIFERGQN